ncbi:MAG: FecR family protein [Geminicoccaceae bacterium]
MPGLGVRLAVEHTPVTRMLACSHLPAHAKQAYPGVEAEGPMLGRILVLVVALLGAACGASAAELVGKVVSQDGKALVLRGPQIATLEVGASLFVDDEVRTAADGRVVIESDDGVRLVIGSATEMKLARWEADRPKRRLDAVISLVTGVMRLIGRETGGERQLRVESRAAVASVRSTEWLVEATGVGMGVFVIEGSVAVASPAGEVTLAAGQGTEAVLGAAPTAPAPWSAARLERVLARVPN